ncbi:MAG: 4Fe-4S binding protein [Eubacterium sp.]|nr:4Fe-4S binding protein [Eubacterium sp.]
MARIITDACVNCGTCVKWCLQDAIHEGDPHMVINPDECMDCRLCEEKCPVGAIINNEKIK